MKEEGKGKTNGRERKKKERGEERIICKVKVIKWKRDRTDELIMRTGNT